MDVAEFARMGGKARAKALTKEERSESARNAVNARWAKAKAEEGRAVKRKKKAAA